MKFQYIAEYRGVLTRSHLCRLMGVSERGLHAWKHRPPSYRQRRDMVLLAHIRDQHRLSLGSYPDFIVRLEAEDRSLPEYVREEFETYLRCGVRISCNRTLPRAGRTRSGRATSLTSGRARGGSIWL